MPLDLKNAIGGLQSSCRAVTGVRHEISTDQNAKEKAKVRMDPTKSSEI